MVRQSNASEMMAELAEIRGTSLKVSRVALGTWPLADGCGVGLTRPSPLPPSAQRSITASTSSIPRRFTASAARRRSSGRRSPKDSCGPGW